MVNRVKVVLCGKEYILRTEDAPSYVYQLAKSLEKSIKENMEKNPSISSHSAVMMVALSTMDELTKANNSIEVIRSQVKEYVDEAGKARLERDAALREVDVLKAKIEQLENRSKLKSLRETAKADEQAAREQEKKQESAERRPQLTVDNTESGQLTFTDPTEE